MKEFFKKIISMEDEIEDETGSSHDEIDEETEEEDEYTDEQLNLLLIKKFLLVVVLMGALYIVVNF